MQSYRVIRVSLFMSSRTFFLPQVDNNKIKKIKNFRKNKIKKITVSLCTLMRDE